MYILNAYRVEEKAELLAFMHQNSFATLVSIVDGSPFASHLPLTVVDNGEQILLRGHFAKANPHWRAHENGGELLTIFHGAHAYISPSQYETQEAVPTWNYIAVHAYGTMRLLAAGAETIATLEQLFAHNGRRSRTSLKMACCKVSSPLRSRSRASKAKPN